MASTGHDAPSPEEKLRCDIEQRLTTHESFFELFNVDEDATPSQVSESFRSYLPYISDVDYDSDQYFYIKDAYAFLIKDDTRAHYKNLPPEEKRKFHNLLRERCFTENEVQDEEEEPKKVQLHPSPHIERLYEENLYAFQAFLEEIHNGKWGLDILLFKKGTNKTLDEMNSEISRLHRTSQHDLACFKVDYLALGSWYKSFVDERSKSDKLLRLNHLADHMSHLGLPDSWIGATGAQVPSRSRPSDNHAATSREIYQDNLYDNSKPIILAVRRNTQDNGLGETIILPSSLFFAKKNNSLHRYTMQEARALASREELKRHFHEAKQLLATSQDGKNSLPVVEIIGAWCDIDEDVFRYPTSYFWVRNVNGGDDVHTRTSLTANMGARKVQRLCRERGIIFLKDRAKPEELRQQERTDRTIQNLVGRLNKVLIINDQPEVAKEVNHVLRFGRRTEPRQLKMDTDEETQDSDDEDDQLFVRLPDNRRRYRSRTGQEAAASNHLNNYDGPLHNQDQMGLATNQGQMGLATNQGQMGSNNYDPAYPVGTTTTRRKRNRKHQNRALEAPVRGGPIVVRSNGPLGQESQILTKREKQSYQSPMITEEEEL